MTADRQTLTCLIHGMAGGLQQQTAKESIKHDTNLEGSNTKREVEIKEEVEVEVF